MELAQLPSLEMTLTKYSCFYQTTISPSHIFSSVCQNQNSNKSLLLTAVQARTSHLFHWKIKKRLGKKPNELTEEILALCNPYFIPCPPEHRSSCKNKMETNWMCEIYSLWGPGSNLGSESGWAATFATVCVRWISWSRAKKILLLISAKLSLFP